jgi:hypothetical protein
MCILIKMISSSPRLFRSLVSIISHEDHGNILIIFKTQTMDTVMSEDVQHGFHSWIDYDRPWILRRSSNIIRSVLSFKATFLMF